MITILKFLMSPAGAQYTYLGMAIMNALLVFDIHLSIWLAKSPRNIVLKNGDLTLYTMAHAGMTIAFLMSVYITGARPVFPVAVLAPYIRLVWFCVLCCLTPSILAGTYKIFRAMWYHSRTKVINA